MMRLRITSKNGEQELVPLTEKPIAIGRSPDADIILADEKISRLHCGIRCENGVFYLKDLKSKNGTLVNDVRVESVRLSHGDRIRLGPFLLTVEDSTGKGTTTVLREVASEMSGGKGYHTILQEIVRDVSNKKP